MGTDDRSEKLAKVMGATLQQKGATETPRAFIETTLNNIATVNEALAEYEKAYGGDFANRQIQLSYAKGALEYLLIFL
ncbi:MAG TPA: hypothetical protein VMS77_10290 [Conexivisphaerales archaeon]|nr:hypothetical protein [Conexivisphaerales archaeon]